MKAYHLAALLFMVMVSACGPDAAESGDSHNLLSTTWSSWPRTDGSTSQVSPNLRAGGSDSSSDPDSSVEKAGLCLTGDCTPITGPSLGISFSSLAYFAPSTNQCLLGDDSVVIKSTQSNRLTVFYRANYAAVGRWQLYAQNIAVDAAGTMSLMGDKVNLHPNCTGNINGVTSFDVTEAEADQSTAGRRALDAKSLERAKSVKIAINCVNTARNVVRTIDLATLRDTTAATTRFLSKDGAVGYWPSKDLYIKGDGSTLTAAGQASSVKIPGGTASMSYSGSPLSTYDYSNTDARAYSSIAGTVTSARVKFTLQHTRMAELTVSLITPDGQNVTLMSGQSQSTPYSADMNVTLPTPTPVAGSWTLRVYDCCRYNTGKIESFEIIVSGLSTISSVLGEDTNGIYLRNGEAVSYISNSLQGAATTAPATVTGTYFNPSYGFMMTHHRDALSINVSTWDQTQNIVTTTDLYPTTLSQGREDYGSSAECLSPGSSITRIDASDVKPSCTTYTADKLWRSRFVPITRNNRTVFWRATAGSDTRSPASSTTPAKSCRDSTQGFRCELVTLDLNNGVIAATKVERQALDYQNIDRGFFGSHWMTERHDGNRGVIYLSNRYFE